MSKNREITREEASLLEALRRITDRGNNAEVKRRRDGSLVVYEVRKNIAASVSAEEKTVKN